MTISDRFNQFKEKVKGTYNEVRGNLASATQNYTNSISSRLNEFQRQPEQLGKLMRAEYDRTSATVKPLAGQAIAPIQTRFNNYVSGAKNYLHDFSVQAEQVNKRFQDYWKKELNEFNTFSEAQQRNNVFMAPGGTSEDRERFRNSPLGQSKLGKVLDFFGESDEITEVRSKLMRGEDLTPHERALANESMTQFMMDIASPVKSVRGGPTKDILEEFVERGTKKLGRGLSEGSQFAGKYAQKAYRGLKDALPTQRQIEKTIDAYSKAGYTTKQMFAKMWPEAYQKLSKVQTIADKKAKPVFDEIFAKWIGKSEASKTLGLKYGMKFREIPEELGMAIINKIENPKHKLSKEAARVWDTQGKRIRQAYDALYKKANDLGLDTRYLNNYVTHYWKQSPEEVEQVFKRLGKKFSGTRKIMTYAEGIEAGLTPKYKHPAQIISHYASRMQRVAANLEFFNKLEGNGFIKKAADAPANWRPITAPGFPKNGTEFWHASDEIVRLIDDVFADRPKSTTEATFNFLGRASAKLQDIAMSGGLLKTPLNSFSLLAGLQKEWLAGKPVSSTLDFLRSFSRKKSLQFFEDNADVIARMQAKNIPMQTEMDMDTLVKKSGITGWAREQFGESVGEVWDKTLSDPTFKRFWPMLQINTYKAVEKAALKKGMAQEVAEEVAAKAVKNFYGTVGSDALAKRSDLAKDVTSTALFAPRYRESLYNFWVNSVKALKNPLALENQMNIRFLLGAGLAYAGMNELNHQINGHGLKDNPPGKEMMLLIPSGETTIGIPWLSSIGFLPRSMYQTLSATVKGDLGEAGQNLKGHSSMLLRGGLDLLSNRNYWGETIVDEDASTGDKWKQVGQYLAQQYSHPYLRPLFEKPETDQEKLRLAAKTLELPVRVYSTKSTDASWYYASRDEALKKLSKAEKEVYEKLHRSKRIDEDGLPIYSQRGTMADSMDRLANPAVFIAEMETAVKTAKENNQPLNPLYELTPEQQRTVLILKTLPPGSEEKSVMTRENIGWLKGYWSARERYFDYLKGEGIIEDTPQDPAKPIVSDDLQAKLDYYYSLPKGTGHRTQFLKQYPELKEYWEKSRAWTNKQRTALGLPPLPEWKDYSSSGGSTKKVKKTAMPSIRAPKLSNPAQISVPKLRVESLKLPKYNSSSRGTAQTTKLPRYSAPQVNYEGARSLNQLGGI